MKIAIIDYGMGNIHSVAKAIALYGVNPLVTNKKSEIASCDKLILPGVGSFFDAMVELEKQDLVNLINEQVKNKKPFLGICLGMQLLFKSSQEAKDKKGLGILDGQVVKFNPTQGEKIPHMGWNDLKVVNNKCPLLNKIDSNSQVYFCHSYYSQPVDKNFISATSNYGLDFASVVWKDNIYGVQFHPEKSQTVGLKIIKNFVELC